ncbi:hypothetical protein D7030_09120 [Flavobacteriaceae bacterium AU392]|nr:hypothetical protein D1817_15125 [Flavobacteriaceae bacterium]RKM84172.1 hypothetical protein D7030_09120 [Flavobacteriaceae bacterium AU392]
MFTGWSHKTKQFFFTLIKVSIVIGACYFIYQKLYNNEDLSFYDVSQFLIRNDMFSLKNALFLLILTSFNWFLEILKWQNLITSFKFISFSEAFKQTLAAHTAAIFTPNRIGDYGVKAMYYKQSLRKRILLLNLIGSLAQMGTTIVFGIVGLLLFISKYDIAISNQNIFICISSIIVIGILMFFIRKSLQVKGVFLSKIITFTTSIKKAIHLKNEILSIFRYLIFSFQYYYLLILFGVDITYFEAMTVISSMYLLSSIIPTIFIFDAVIKGSVALYLFSFLGVNEFIILSITTCMWLLNFALPTVFGTFFVLTFKSTKVFNKAINIK